MNGRKGIDMNTTVASTTQARHEQMAQVAKAIGEREGRQAGRDLDRSLRAERELSPQPQAGAAAATRSAEARREVGVARAATEPNHLARLHMPHGLSAGEQLSDPGRPAGALHRRRDARLLPHALHWQGIHAGIAWFGGNLQQPPPSTSNAGPARASRRVNAATSAVQQIPVFNNEIVPPT
jgi:hypothetical protein